MRTSIQKEDKNPPETTLLSSISTLYHDNRVISREFAAIFNVSMDYLAGMEKHSNISTFGMNPEQIAITKNLIETFRKKNISTFQKMSAEHYQIIGKIAVELSK